MSGYSKFAWFYDRLTANVDYDMIGKRIDALVSRFGGKKDILLELGCGTGSLCEKMAELGYDVIGVDCSEDMLSEALNKKIDSGSDIQYLCQDMTELDLYGTVDVAISVLDCINHLPDIESIKRTFEKVSLFTYHGGLFIFDVNTVYKHREVLADNAYTYDLDGLFCAWQNEYCADDNSVEMFLDFFEENDNNTYNRYQEYFTEIAFEDAQIDKMLADSGFQVLSKFDDYTENAVNDKTERIVYVAKKIGS